MIKAESRAMEEDPLGFQEHSGLLMRPQINSEPVGHGSGL